MTFACLAVVFAELAELKSPPTRCEMLQSSNSSMIVTSLMIKLSAIYQEISGLEEIVAIQNFSALQAIESNQERLNDLFRFLMQKESHDNIPATCAALPHSSPSGY